MPGLEPGTPSLRGATPTDAGNSLFAGPFDSCCSLASQSMPYRCRSSGVTSDGSVPEAVDGPHPEAMTAGIVEAARAGRAPDRRSAEHSRRRPGSRAARLGAVRGASRLPSQGCRSDTGPDSVPVDAWMSSVADVRGARRRRPRPCGKEEQKRAATLRRPPGSLRGLDTMPGWIATSRTSSSSARGRAGTSPAGRRRRLRPLDEPARGSARPRRAGHRHPAAPGEVGWREHRGGAKHAPELVGCAVYDRTDSTLVGTAGLLHIDHANGTAEFAIVIDERRGQASAPTPRGSRSTSHSTCCNCATCCSRRRSGTSRS
jgi:hypothetical protein